MRSPLGPVAPLTVAIMVAVAACGGADSVDTGLAEVTEGSVSVDADGNGEMQIGDAVGQLGNDLGIPDWLPAGFPLPDDADIIATETDPDSSDLLASTMADTAAFRSSTVAWLEANGYEIVLDFQGDLGYEFVATLDGVVFEGELRGGTLEVGVSRRNIQLDLQRAAETVTGPGTATVRIGDVDTTVDGTCDVTGLVFNFTADAGVTVVELRVDASTDGGPFGSTFVMVNDPATATIAQYSMTYPSGDPSDPIIAVEASTASIEGTWYGLDLQPATGAIVVSCDI